MDDDDRSSSPFMLIYNILNPTHWNVTGMGNVNVVIKEKK
jgi:hypothetical protein